jgi:hypothetical protein
MQSPSPSEVSCLHVVKGLQRVFGDVERQWDELRRLRHECVGLASTLVNLVGQMAGAASADTDLGVLSPFPRIRERLMHKVWQQLRLVHTALTARVESMRAVATALGSLVQDGYVLYEPAAGLLASSGGGDQALVALPMPPHPCIADQLQWLEDIHVGVVAEVLHRLKLVDATGPFQDVYLDVGRARHWQDDWNAIESGTHANVDLILARVRGKLMPP